MTKNTETPFIFGGEDLFDKSMFPGAYGESLMSLYKLNYDLLTTTQQIAMETAQTLIALNQQYQQRVYNQMNELIQYNMSKSPLEEKTSYHARAAQDAVDLMSSHAMGISSLLVDSNKKLSDTVQKGFKEGLDETISAVKKAKE